MEMWPGDMENEARPRLGPSWGVGLEWLLLCGVTEGRDSGQEAQLSAMLRKSEKGILGRRENATEASPLSGGHCQSR